MGRSGRYELKYILNERQAVQVADYVSHHLPPSEFNGSGPIPGEPVVSLYLDSPDLVFFRQASAGHKNRIKLRIRFYDDEWENPAFMEVKRRVSDVIVKGRAKITREGVRQMLSRGWPYHADHRALIHGMRRQMVLEDFVRYANAFRARGMIYISYFRETYASEDESLRVTFDRRIRGSRCDDSGRLGMPKLGWPPLVAPYFPPNGIVLELKFEKTAPGWMRRMVQAFNLQRTSFCKYMGCINSMGLQWGAPIRPHLEERLAM